MTSSCDSQSRQSLRKVSTDSYSTTVGLMKSCFKLGDAYRTGESEVGVGVYQGTSCHRMLHIASGFHFRTIWSYGFGGVNIVLRPKLRNAKSQLHLDRVLAVIGAARTSARTVPCLAQSAQSAWRFGGIHSSGKGRQNGQGSRGSVA